MRLFFLCLLLCGCLLKADFQQEKPPRRKLLVISVDGLDWRYLRDRDQMGLRIPTFRKLMQEGNYANGVVGVFPTITWPSHTSLITGKRPDQHGIQGNRRPHSEGGDYYWTPDLLKARTLWQAAHAKGLTTASITWPVTLGADIDFDLPEYFTRRNGGFMDLAGIEAKGTPGLVAEISRLYPSFPQQWMDDRTRTLAALYLLQKKQPDLILLHLVDLDSEEHDQGPFTVNANAVLERTDELIGDMLRALPAQYDLAVVSDHGFERVDRSANLSVLMTQRGVKGNLQSLGGVCVTSDDSVAQLLRSLQGAEYGIGREIPHDELIRYAPQLSKSVAAFEPVEHIMFGFGAESKYFTAPAEKGNHGFWPTRSDYRSIFIAYGPAITAHAEPEMQMTSIAGRLASLIGVNMDSDNQPK